MIPTCRSCRALMARCTRRNRCRACRRDHYCLNCPGCHTSLCTRERSDRPTASGLQWWHLDAAPRPGPARRPARPAPDAEPIPPASVEHRDGVYCVLLRRFLALSDEHRTRLMARGLSGAEIGRNGYASTPTRARGDEIAAALSAYGLEGMPGFYRDGGRWRMVRTRPGYFVPYRDERGRVQAMQYRLDAPLAGKTKYLWLSSRECSSGAPLHHAYHHLLADAEEVTVTEGALKADLIAYLTQAPVVAVAGVSCFGADFAAHLRAVAPRLRAAVVAYDMDLLANPQVRAALEALAAQLQRARLRVRVRTWPPHWKGYDDYLVAQLQRQEARAA